LAAELVQRVMPIGRKEKEKEKRGRWELNDSDVDARTKPHMLLSKAHPAPPLQYLNNNKTFFILLPAASLLLTTSFYYKPNQCVKTKSSTDESKSSDATDRET